MLSSFHTAVWQSIYYCGEKWANVDNVTYSTVSLQADWSLISENGKHLVLVSRLQKQMSFLECFTSVMVTYCHYNTPLVQLLNNISIIYVGDSVYCLIYTAYIM